MEQSVTCGDMYQIPISSAVAVTLKTRRFLSLKKYNIKSLSLFKFGVFCAVFALCFCIGASLVLLRPGGLEGRFNKVLPHPGSQVASLPLWWSFL